MASSHPSKPADTVASEAPVPIAVLASGSGTNLQALLDADLTPAYVALVIVNVADAPAFARATRRGVTSLMIEHAHYSGRNDFEQAISDALNAAKIEWIVLAGFMRVLSSGFVDRYRGRIVNIHPSLLPAFPGLDAQKKAWASGVKVTGCTVHLVDGGVDTGPILAQASVPVLPTDDVNALSTRILAEEHRIFPRVIRELAMGHLGTTRSGHPYVPLDDSLNIVSETTSE
jgi:phosphoribosylglycinamide formyltransferase 1